MHAVASALPGGLPGKFTAPLRNAKKFARSAALDFEDRYLGFGTYFTDSAKARLMVDDVRQSVRGMDAYRNIVAIRRVKHARPTKSLVIC